MELIQLVDSLSHEMYLRLKCAAETGKWPEGTPVDSAQQTSALQISMAYQSRHLNATEFMSVGADGEIVTKTKRELKKEFSQSESETSSDDNTIARFSDL